MQIDKNINLAMVVTGIFYLPTEVPIEIDNGTDKFHKKVFLAHNVFFKELYFTPGSATFEEKEKEEDAGITFTQELKFKLPGEDDDTTALLSDLRGRPLVVKFVYGDGRKKLIGLPANPARFTRTNQISQKTASADISFICVAQESAWWISYEGEVIPR